MVSCSKDTRESWTQLITPTGNSSFLTENNGGNVTCDEVAAATGCKFEHTSGRIDYSGGSGGIVGPIKWSTNGTFVEWTSSVPVKIAVIVKGGPTANVYSDCGVCKSGSGTVMLSAPINPANNKPYGLSNITFCWSECPQVPKIVAFKGRIIENPFDTEKPWVVTGPVNNFIGCVDFVPGVKYSLYFGGDATHQAGTLEIGNFDSDLALEVKVNITSSVFTDGYLLVASAGECSVVYENYNHQKHFLSTNEIIFDL